MRVFLALLVLSFLTFSQKAYAQMADWTLLVYIVGSDLESGSGAATEDIGEMIAGGEFTDYVNVLVLTGGSNKPGWETPRSFIIQNGVQTELTFQPSNTNMATPGNVTEFINWGTQNYPATSYMLTFWNHGGDFRGYGWEESMDDHFSVPQIKQAVAASDFIQNGNKFDVIGFDACLMAAFEVQYMLKDFAYYYVGSEETEPGHGWDWQAIVTAAEAGNALYGDEMGTIIVDSYLAHANDYGTTGITLGVMNLEEIPNLEAKLENLANAITSQSKVASLQQAVSATEEYGKAIQYPETSSDVVDLGDLMYKLKSIDPSLTTEADEVLAALGSTVVHQVNDMARPFASGISIYFPHNVLVNDAELDYVVQSEYSPLELPSTWKNFILNTYIPFVTSDNSAPNGLRKPEHVVTRDLTSDSCYSALTITHDSDLEHVQIVLVEEFDGVPDEYILLGSTIPDSIAYVNDSMDTYFYFWDEQWLGINGHPGYISDIHDYQLEDEFGNLKTYQRVHIPAILNYETDGEKDIMMSYRIDEGFNVTLEGIFAEHTGGVQDRIVPKERINLQPGDQVQLLYEVFDEVTDEEYFVVDEDAVITIENGNSDLHLEHDQLEVGNYHIGYVLLDHSHNDTIIFDDTVFKVVSSPVKDLTEVPVQIQLYPNPADEGVYIENLELESGPFVVRLADMNGRTVLEVQGSSDRLFLNTQHLPNGIYNASVIQGNKVFTEKIVIQH